MVDWPEPSQAILNFPSPVPDSLTQGFTFGQEFVTEIVDPAFTNAATALSAGEYGLAAYDELVGLDTTPVVPLEEIITGAAASFPSTVG